MTDSLFQYATNSVNTAFPGAFLVPLNAASKFVGFSGGTARNRLCAGTLPFKTVKQNGFQYVPAGELAGYIAKLMADSGFVPPVQPEPAPAAIGEQVKRGRGRPRKSASSGVAA